MTLEEFSSLPLHSGILTENERSAILDHLKNQDNCITPMPSHLSNSRKQRQSRSFASHPNEIRYLRRITNEKSCLLCPIVYHSVSLTVDKNIMITGIVLADTDLSKYVTFQKLFETTTVISQNCKIFLFSSQMWRSSDMEVSDMEVSCELLDSKDCEIGSAKVSRPRTRFMKLPLVFSCPVLLKRNKAYSIRIAFDGLANFLLGILYGLN